jgi:hypothetical protein
MAEYFSAMEACGLTISPGSPFITARFEWQEEKIKTAAKRSNR